MNEHEIYLPRKLINQMLHWAQQSPDKEICGLVGATDGGSPTSCYPISNTSCSPETRFEMDASEQIAALRTMRNRGEQLFAIYHSHPGAPAEPSKLDIEQANHPDAVYLIISLNTKGVLEMRGFKLDNGNVAEQVLRLVEKA